MQGSAKTRGELAAGGGAPQGWSIVLDGNYDRWIAQYLGRK
jgi:hypothetical protein